MRILRHLVLVTALLVIALNYPGLSASRPGQFQEFTLTLETPKTKYLELEPIPIVVTLKNETDAPLVGHSALGFTAGYLRLFVTGKGGPRQIDQLSLRTSFVDAKPHEFKPGEEVKKKERLNLRLNEIFPKPGTYELTARLMSSDGKETVSSKPVEVEIVQPDGLDAHALQFIREHDEPAYFFTGARVLGNPEKLQALESFVAVFGQSTYADEASYLLGEVQFAKRDYQKARNLFEKLSKKSDYAFAGQATEYLKRIEREEKKKDRP